MNLYTPRGRGLPGWPPRPMRVATSAPAARRKGSSVDPVQPVAVVEARAGLGRLLGQPVGDDVVVDLVVGRDLDQLHHALAPVAERLDPEAGPLVVADAVQIVVEDAVALQQAEAARARRRRRLR